MSNKASNKAANRAAEAEFMKYDSYVNGGVLEVSESLSGSMNALGENTMCNGSKGHFILKEETRNRRKSRINRTRIVLVLLVFFIATSVVLGGLLAWVTVKRQDIHIDEKQEKCKEEKPCQFMPDPIPFKTLPENLKKKLDEMEVFVKNEIEREQATALSANLVYMDKVIWEGGFGDMSPNKTRKDPPSPTTLYPCASLTKILTSLMLFKLRSDGKIQSLDAPLKQYEPEFSIENPYGRRNITLRNLASQRSGLQREAPCYPSKPKNLCPYNYSTMLQRVSALTLLRSPGVKPQYSNLGWSLLGQILARSFGNGSDYKHWMKADLLQPSGMTSSTFSPTKSQISSIPLTKQSSTIMDWGWLDPAGGLFSSVHDLAQMEMKLFANEILDSRNSRDFFKEDYIFPDGVTMTGMPWEIYFHKGRLIRGKIAYIYGYNSYVAIVPEMKLAFNFMCTDCNLGLNEPLQKYVKTLVETMDEEFHKASIKVNQAPKNAKQYIGRFTSDKILPIPLHMDVHLNPNNQLAISINSGKDDLLYLDYVKPQTFKMHLNPRRSCRELFTFGVEDDFLYFDQVSSLTGLSGGFTMHNVHPGGKTYFSRDY